MLGYPLIESETLRRSSRVLSPEGVERPVQCLSKTMISMSFAIYGKLRRANDITLFRDREKVLWVGEWEFEL